MPTSCERGFDVHSDVQCALLSLMLCYLRLILIFDAII